MKNCKKSITAVMAILVIGCFYSCCETLDETALINITNGATTMIAFADQTTVNNGNGITFKTTQSWNATISHTSVRATSEQNDWIKLSSYHGGVGEHQLSILLEPNNTGAAREALLQITSGNATQNIVIQQTSDKKHHISSTLSHFNGKLVTQITGITYCDGQECSYDTIQYQYDNQNRVVNYVIIDQYTLANRTVRTVTETKISHGDNIVSYQCFTTQNGIPSKFNPKGTITLDAYDRAVSGNYTRFNENNDLKVHTHEYTISYNAKGQREKVVSHNDDNTSSHKYIASWNNDNPVRILWGSVSTGTNSVRTSYATYGSVYNNTNIDLNCALILITEGFDHATGDPMKIFSVLGYTGVRSVNMATTVEEEGNSCSTYSYTLDGDDIVGVKDNYDPINSNNFTQYHISYNQ